MVYRTQELDEPTGAACTQTTLETHNWFHFRCADCLSQQILIEGFLEIQQLELGEILHRLLETV
jgi:hypothetical protein